VATTDPLLALARTVTDAGGVARCTTLVERGHSRYRIDRAIAAGWLVRVRRNWVALADADAELVDASRRGVVLTCVTLARRRGLWVPSDGEVAHVAARADSSAYGTRGVVVHWRRPVMPRHPDALEDSIENALVLAATCMARESALAIWESALRQGLVSRDGLSRLHLPPAARALLTSAVGWSDSGLETLFRDRLRWLGIRILPQAWILGRRVDFLIGERLVIQIDGGTHVGAQRTSDIAHDAELALRGFHVLRFSYAHIMHDWPHVQDTIMRAVAQGLHLAQRP